jgi:uncharacterized protein YlxP (DUF503 family)
VWRFVADAQLPDNRGGRPAVSRRTAEGAEVTMTIGVARVTLHLEGSQSLKDKRQVVRSLTKRVQNQFNAAIAEVEDLDDMRIATLGLCTLSNNASHVDQMLANVIDFIERNVELGVLAEIETELIHV